MEKIKDFEKRLNELGITKVPLNAFQEKIILYNYAILLGNISLKEKNIRQLNRKIKEHEKKKFSLIFLGILIGIFVSFIIFLILK